MFTKEKIRIFFYDRPSRIFFIGSCILILGQTVFLLITFSLLPPQVPLFYSLPWGEKQLAERTFLFVLPLSSFFFLSINSALAIITFTSDYFLERMFLVVSFLIAFLSFFGLWMIVSILT